MNKKRTTAYHCNSCNKCTNCYCNFYKRPVDKNFNRCKHHSTNEPNTQAFKVADNLETIMKQEEEANKKHEALWLAEQEQMRKLA